jgi:hypothetical protein
MIMSKNFMVALCVFLLLSKTSAACDICGGGVSNMNPYLFPHLSKPYFGISYFRHLYHTRTEEGTMNQEAYNALLFTAQYGVGKHIQLSAALPYQFNQLYTARGTRNISGLGDVSLFGSYKLWEHMTTTIRQTVTLGAGIKLPAGKYTPVGKSDTEEQNFQLGTGSVDYLLNATYRIALPKWVFAATTAYKYNNQNSDGYRFGDVWTSGLTAVYRKEGENLSLLPYVTLSEEHFMRDADQHILQNHSGGDVLLGGLGLDINTRKVAFGVNYQAPVSHNIAQGDIAAGSRFSARFSFML